jgi:oligopeptidase A
MSNPLENIKNLPPFTVIKAKHIEPALTACLQQNLAQIETLLSNNTDYTWENLIAPMEVAENQLERLWSPVSHMNSVVNTPKLRDAYNAGLPKLSEYSTAVGQNKALFQAIQTVRNTQADLDNAQKKALDDSIRSFQLSGVDLSGDKQSRYKEISTRLSKLSADYSDHVLDATTAWSKHITEESMLEGLPDSALAMAAQAAQQRDLKGWVISLDFPSYYAVITYADNAKLRKELYRAYSTRASTLGDHPKLDNSATMREILQLKKEKAVLLGFANYAELSIASKMADSADAVSAFLRDLAIKAKPFAEKELCELQQFAQDNLGLEQLNAWDIAYSSEKLKQDRYNISDEELKPYFAVNNVLSGLFQLVEKLYGIAITEKSTDIELWHQDVQFYQIHNAKGELQAEFYLDLYARAHKRGGAWMDHFCSRFRTSTGLQTPVAYMTCNSTPPVGDEPALFTHDEVVTLFHEFGHGLHHMLTQVEYLDVSGINGVEWDAVELPSQFMENFCWEKQALSLFAKHYKTGEILPDALIEKMQASKNFQSAMATLRQVEFALFDMQIHQAEDAAEKGRIAAILKQVRQEIAVLQPPEFNRFENSFSHIFAGGYSAGYYSYKWAEVLSEDAFARFEEEGLFNPEVGAAFLKEILQVGGSRPAMESFKAFRGREPSADALLRRSGLQ